MKTFWFLTALTLSFLASALTPPSAFAGNDTIIAPKVTLNPTVTVDGDIIYLGDLFKGIGDKANTAVAYAPQPGKRAVLDAKWLGSVARAQKIDWQPISHRVRVVVERNTIVIEREEIEDRIMAALAEHNKGNGYGYGFDDSLRLTLSNRLLRLYVPATGGGRIGVEHLDFDPVSGRFAAIITAPEGDPAAARHRVTGRMQRMARVPVLAERLLAGEIIREDHLKTLWLPADKLQKNILTQPEQLIGKSPKRGLTPDRPIRSAEVRAPILVPRGGLVTIRLQLANMMLTAQGKALENGSKGDVVRIQNTQSNKTIQAVVTGSGVVVVRSAAQELAENTSSTSSLQW